MSFKKNKYQVIREAIPKELANFGFTYLKYLQKQTIG